MNQNDNQPDVLNRIKSKENTQNSFQRMLQEVEKETINSTLATQFPKWDLSPPATLIKRRSTKLL